ncbi:MAG: chloride channel protein, partial [Pseudomonadales bacterium]|nr:chloride channel protein [Pseudomonadales bacterium]
LGATGSSLIGQWLKLPNNSLRTLVGCGTAAAIAASFNTPLAGVIFAMEVVMMEYTIAGFAPIILAAVTGAVIAQVSHGQEPAFQIPELSMHSLWELPYIAFEGFVIGCAAALFIYIYRRCTAYQHVHIFKRIMLAGLLTALVSIISPEIMGIGYDSMEQALNGQIVIKTLVLFFVCKLLISAAVMGLGMPGGLIGPSLLIGALLGGIVGYVGQQLWPGADSSTGLYALLGMTAMMGAVLSAPLSALMTALELTHAPGMMLPSMLSVMIAFLTCRILFRQKSIFESAINSTVFSSQRDNLISLLQRVGVTSVMSDNFKRCRRYLPPHEATHLLSNQPQWIIIQNGEDRIVLRAADLAHHLEERIEEGSEAETTEAIQNGQEKAEGKIDLLAIPGLRKDAVTLDMRASLGEALTKLDETGVQTLLVCRTSAPMITPIVGILTRDDIENYYHVPR